MYIVIHRNSQHRYLSFKNFHLVCGLVCFVSCEHLSHVVYTLHYRNSNGLSGKAAAVHTVASGVTEQPNTTTTHPTADWSEQSKTVTGTRLIYRMIWYASLSFWFRLLVRIRKHFFNY